MTIQEEIKANTERYKKAANNIPFAPKSVRSSIYGGSYITKDQYGNEYHIEKNDDGAWSFGSNDIFSMVKTKRQALQQISEY